MADISKCMDSEFCKIRNRCYRYTAKDGYHQSYQSFNKGIVEEEKDCDYFWNNKKGIVE